VKLNDTTQETCTRNLHRCTRDHRAWFDWSAVFESFWYKQLAWNLSPVHTVAENGDCHQKLRLSPNSATTATIKSATIVASVDRLLEQRSIRCNKFLAQVFYTFVKHVSTFKYKVHSLYTTLIIIIIIALTISNAP